MKTGWERYASEKRYVQKGYFRKYSDGSSGRKTREASRRDSIQKSRKEQKEEVVELSGNSGQLDDPLMEYGRHVVLTEEVVYIGDENGKSEVGIGEPIQSSGEGCSKVGSKKSSSRSSRSRNEKVRKGKNGKDGGGR